MIRILFFVFIASFFYSDFSKAQGINLGIPFSKSFSKKNYNAGTQNWDIIKDKRGVVYFANNQGMLQFDGKRWACYPLPNKTIVRSLAIDSSGKIYAGGQNELGYFTPNAKGDWAFHSLRKLLPKVHQNFEDVWDIIIQQGNIYFRTSKKIYCYKNGKISVLLPNSESVFSFISTLGQKIIIQDSKQGLFFLKDTLLIAIPDSEVFKHSPLTGILPIGKNKWLITTLSTGCFKFDGKKFTRWQPQDHSFLIENKIYSSAIFSNGQLAFGTSFGGLLIIHSNGRTLHHLSKENGLLNNNILTLKTDSKNNLWVGLDNGINYVLTGSAFTYFSPDGKSEGAGYSALEYGNKYYFGTANGLFSIDRENYYSPLWKKQFEQIDKTKGQAWRLDRVGEKLLLGHHGGAYTIEKNSSEKITPDWGYWLFEAIDSTHMIAGTYKGLVLFKKINGNWKYQHYLKGFEESSRFLEQDHLGNIWVAHPYKGVFKIVLDNEYNIINVKKYGAADGLSSDLMNHIFKVNNELIFCSEFGIYKYEANTDQFSPYEEYNKLLGNSISVKRLFETTKGNIWYVTDTGLGILEVSEKSILKEVYKKPFPKQIREQMVSGFESIHSTREGNVFIGAEKGFIHFDSKKELVTDSSFQVILQEVSCTSKGDSIISRGLFFENGQVLALQPNSEIPEFPHWMNAFRFSFSATDFTQTDGLQFQYFLEGLEEDWSSWNEKSEKEYTNLQPGNYSFHIKALSNEGIETNNQFTYQFEILSPWYWSAIAKIIYTFITISLLSGIIFFFNRKYHKQREKVVQSEKVIDQLNSEKLEVEVAHKNRELFSSVIHLQHKNEILSKIKKELNKIEKESNNQSISKHLKAVIKMMEMEDNSDLGFDQFMAHFNEIHTDFFDRLRNEFPELSPKDLKLCAYLRMNLSTKEIALLLNNTIRGVEGGRYRLRKKMDLDNKVNLTEYILRF